MGFRDLKCRNGAQNRNLHEKLSKTGHVEKFWLWSKSTVRVNGKLLTCDDVACVTSPRADVAGRDAAAGACGAWVRVVWCVGVRGRYWRRVAARRARAREAETSCGAWGRVWCSFWPFLVGFCSGLDVLSFYACYLAVECTERWYPSVAVLWAWRRWLASNSDDWMKARAAEERQRCPQEAESQRNGSDTLLTI